jgi:hypothetical protein
MTLLGRLEQNKVVYEDWRWKVSYGMPKHGKDFWGRKAEERERLERETGKRTKRSMILSWRRSRKRDDGEERGCRVQRDEWEVYDHLQANSMNQDRLTRFL